MSTKNKKNEEEYVEARKFLRENFGHTYFGDILGAYRYREEMTQVQMAKFLGISKQELCNIEKKRKFVSVQRAIDFAKKLDASERVFAKYVLRDQLYRAGIEADVKIVDVA